MKRLVLKFGGTSVANLERIAHVAEIVAARRAETRAIAVVVSAMSGTTNQLVEWTRGAAGPDLHGVDYDDEYDVVVASGEQVTAGLLALALRRKGLKARSWLGWQLKLSTDEAHGKARITGCDNPEFIRSVDSGEIAVVAGFQGVDENGRVSTLGRGGSDTSAVAVAAALKASLCDIYTDVDGVYTTDPRITPKAQRIEKISYEEMLELASLGAKVLQTRSVELAMNHRVPVRVLSSFEGPVPSPNTGTLVCDEEQIVEKQVVSGVAYSRDEAKFSMIGVEDHPGVAATIFGALADAGVNVDMIVQASAKTEGRQNIVFTCPDRRWPRESRARKAQRQCRLRKHDRVPRRGEGLRHRRRHAQPRRRRQDDVPGPVRQGHQHPGHFDLRDQDFRPDRCVLHRAGRTRPAHGLRSGFGLIGFGLVRPRPSTDAHLRCAAQDEG